MLMVMGAARPADDYEVGPLTERILNLKGMEIVDQVAWTVSEITWVRGHPDDADYLLQLPEIGPTVSLSPTWPYGGNRETGFANGRWPVSAHHFRSKTQDFRWGPRTH
ncbi:hypothetical protein ACK8N7_37255 [Streptomyces griseobrunneus]